MTTTTVKTPIKTPTLKLATKPSIKTPLKKLGKEKEIGATWTKQPKNGGEEYMTGDITVNGEKVSIILFRNNFKDQENKPDWRIYVRDPMEEKSTKTEQPEEVTQNADTSFLT
jgi:uncharacterized protein (DUF736 family)